MKNNYWLGLCVVLLWTYPQITYSLSPVEDKAKEDLRSTIEAGKKGIKEKAARQDRKIPTEPIRPFGPFSWEDDFLTAALKANALPGVEAVSVSIMSIIGAIVEPPNIRELSLREVNRVLPHFHGRLSEEFFPFLPECESPPLPGIMAALDVVKDIRSRLGSRPVLLAVHAFPLEHAEETLGRRVVRA
jgi:hypothetical protein